MPSATGTARATVPLRTRRYESMAAPAEHEPFEHGDVDHEPSELIKGAGKNARDVGVSTRHAVRGDGSEEGEIDVPQDIPGRPTFPRGTERSDDGAPTEVENFAPREATPPSVTP
jgi:hypothetical protein